MTKANTDIVIEFSREKLNESYVAVGISQHRVLIVLESVEVDQRFVKGRCKF